MGEWSCKPATHSTQYSACVILNGTDLKCVRGEVVCCEGGVCVVRGEVACVVRLCVLRGEVVCVVGGGGGGGVCVGPLIIVSVAGRGVPQIPADSV